jgi:hypothetical protein
VQAMMNFATTVSEWTSCSWAIVFACLLLHADACSLNSTAADGMTNKQVSHDCLFVSFRLALRWLHGHFFSGLFRTEAVELLVAYLFLFPRPYGEPSNHFTAFLRYSCSVQLSKISLLIVVSRFLHLLATFDFEHQPIIVDIAGSFSAEDYTKITSKFHLIREHKPQDCAIFIAYGPDPDSVMWTKEKPSKMVS